MSANKVIKKKVQFEPRDYQVKTVFILRRFSN